MVVHRNRLPNQPQYVLEEIAFMDALEGTESHRTEPLAETLGETAVRAPAPRISPKDNRSLFIDAMGDPIRRCIAFDIVERNAACDFA
jgi:hypothetical protein